MTHAALYLRISTDDGRQSLENQRLALQAFAARRGWQIAAEYSDEESGATPAAKRPGLAALLDDAMDGSFDTVLAFSLSRLSRGGAGETILLLQRLEHLGVAFVSATEEFISTAGPFGPACVAIMATLAQIEREQLSERVRAGLVRARARGKICHRPRRRIDLTVIEALRRAGKTIAQIAQETGASQSTITRRLKEIQPSTR